MNMYLFYNKITVTGPTVFNTNNTTSANLFLLEYQDQNPKDQKRLQ